MVRYKNNQAVAAKRDLEFGRNDALGALPVVLDPIAWPSTLTRARRFRAPPAPVRIQQRVPEILAKSGLRFTGLSPDKNLVEIVELPTTPGFWGASSPGVQVRPMEPHPIFAAFAGKALEEARRKDPEAVGSASARRVRWPGQSQGMNLLTKQAANTPAFFAGT